MRSVAGKIYGFTNHRDYYRFSPQPLEGVFLGDCTGIEPYDMLNPP
jgi:hypothetical protein